VYEKNRNKRAALVVHVVLASCLLHNELFTFVVLRLVRAHAIELD
jgi:hypothetical protein